jgi:hypothetical protein
MKRIALIATVVVFAALSALAAEQSPDRSHVKIVNVPRQCLEAGSAEVNGVKYTCTKIDSSEVWNELELQKFDKDIFDAYREPMERTRIGLVVRQDTVYTTERVQRVADEKNEVALVERRDGYKYKYARR